MKAQTPKGSEKRKKAETALLDAAENGDLAVLQDLLGADPSLAQTARFAEGAWSSGMTALSVAAWRGNAQAVKFLLPHSDVSIQNQHGHTALMLTANGHSAECVKLLLTKDPTEQASKVDGSEKTALILTAERGGSVASVACLRNLLPHSDTKLQDENGRTALMAAAFWGWEDCLKVLLPYSDIGQKDNDDRTALDLAIGGLRWRCVDILGAAGSADLTKETLARALSESGCGEDNFPRMKAMVEKSELQSVLVVSASLVPLGETGLASRHRRGL